MDGRGEARNGERVDGTEVGGSSYAYTPRHYEGSGGRGGGDGSAWDDYGPSSRGEDGIIGKMQRHLPTTSCKETGDGAEPRVGMGQSPALGWGAGRRKIFTSRRVGRKMPIRIPLDFNEPNKVLTDKGETSLQLAIIYKSPIGVIRRLLWRGGDPDIRQNSGKTSVILAVYVKSSPNVMKLLLDSGGDPNIMADGGYTAVYAAAKKNASPEILELLLKKGGDPNLCSDDNTSPLFIAAQENVNPELVGILLKWGARPNLQRDTGGTPLLIAAYKNSSLEIVKLLLDAGANPNLMSNAGRTPLLAAVEENSNPALVALLLQYRANPMVRKDGKNLLHFVKNAETARLLLAAGVDPDPEDTRYSIQTPLMTAGAADPQITELLISRGANPNVVGPGGVTAYTLGSEDVREWYNNTYGPQAYIPSNRGRIDMRSKARIERDLALHHVLDSEVARRPLNPDLPVRTLPSDMFRDRVLRYLYGRSRRRRRRRSSL